jgi:hypothetical protein
MHRWIVWLVCGLAASSGCRQQAGGLALAPAEVDFGNVALGRDSIVRVELHNRGDAPMTVTQVAAPDEPAFAVEGLPVTLEAGKASTMTVHYRPAALGTHACAVQLATDSAETRTAALSLHGTAVRGLATLSGDHFDFGTVLVNEVALQDLALVNADASAQTSVQIGSLQGPGSQAFRIALQGTLPLAPRQASQLRLQFKPGDAGDFSATVAVTPCPTCAPQDITLEGKGVVSLVAFDPPTLDFGAVPLGHSAQRAVRLANLGQSPLELSSVVSTTPELGLDLPADTVLPPGQSLDATATYSPVSIGARQGALSLAASAGTAAVLTVAATGTGPLLQATPGSLSAGAAAVGTTRTATLSIGNVGLDPDGRNPLELTSVRVEAPAGDWSVQETRAAVGGPGSQVSLHLSFTPRSAGASAATLVVESNDARRGHLEVPLRGLGRQLSPCTVSISPAAPVDFGATPVFQPSVQGFELVNAGADDCIVGDLVLDGDGFAWPGGDAPRGRTVPPGKRMSVRIQFQPRAGQSYAGSVRFSVSNPAAPTVVVPLHGDGDAGCFFLTPGAADFGGTTLSCAVPRQTVRAVNHCAAVVTVTSVELSGAPFSSSMPVPFTVPPQGSVPIDVTYQPSSPGDDVGFIRAITSMGTGPQAGLTGGAQPHDAVVDQWIQERPKVDLLVVVDDSASMVEEQRALQQSLDAIWKQLFAAGVDFHLAVTTTGMDPVDDTAASICPGGARGGEAGRFFPVDGSSPRILTETTPDLRQALAANLAVGTCHWDERFLEPAVAAVTKPLSDAAKAPGSPFAADGNAGFLREGARLSILAVSDTDDDANVPSPPPVAESVARLAAVKHGSLDLISFAGIVPLRACSTAEQIGARYHEIARELDGTLYDICDLGELSAILGAATRDLLLPETSFALSAHPQDPSAIQVKVDGEAVISFTYDSAHNRVVFDRFSVPAAGAEVSVSYVPGCQ